jgi:hypothetical protein
MRQRLINIRVTQQQYELIQLKKEQAGYISLSDFIRTTLLKNNLWTEKMLKEIHDAVVRKE